VSAPTAKRGGSLSGEPLRVLGYTRVSTEDQAESGAGLAAQRSAIHAACQARGLELVDIVEDAGWSGKSLERPGLATALGQLDAGKVDAIVVAKLDRLSRSLIDFANLMERARRRGWAVVALDLGVDTTTAAGELVANVMASVAQWERRTIGDRTRVAMAEKAAAGVRIGRPRVLPDDVVARILTERAAGRRLVAIADGLTADGVPTARGGSTWRASTVESVLKSRLARI
jgi:DNA invertase Pin-like site-specific DNA recombinase